jgi:hypothetical protein
MTSLTPDGPEHLCNAVSKDGQASAELRASVIIAAHGSWETGALPTQPARRLARASDLFGFKGHFRDCDLPQGLMPLLCFPGGYGGMVQTDNGRVSLSWCLRRDWLEKCRGRHPGVSAAQAALQHILVSCRAARRVLANARPQGGLALGRADPARCPLPG